MCRQQARGSYVLLVRLAEERTIAVGRLGTVRFPGGSYAYVGSALRGLAARVDRHLRAEKKTRWHIDYLLPRATIEAIITCETTERTECTIAQTLAQRFDSIPGFGSSDCRCRSHLFLAAEPMTSAITTMLDALGLEPRLREPVIGRNAPG